MCVCDVLDRDSSSTTRLRQTAILIKTNPLFVPKGEIPGVAIHVIGQYRKVIIRSVTVHVDVFNCFTIVKQLNAMFSSVHLRHFGPHFKLFCDLSTQSGTKVLSVCPHGCFRVSHNNIGPNRDYRLQKWGRGWRQISLQFSPLPTEAGAESPPHYFLWALACLKQGLKPRLHHILLFCFISKCTIYF